jgi:hypothetical protein
VVGVLAVFRVYQLFQRPCILPCIAILLPQRTHCGLGAPQSMQRLFSFVFAISSSLERVSGSTSHILLILARSRLRRLFSMYGGLERSGHCRRSGRDGGEKRNLAWVVVCCDDCLSFLLDGYSVTWCVCDVCLYEVWSLYYTTAPLVAIRIRMSTASPLSSHAAILHIPRAEGRPVDRTSFAMYCAKQRKLKLPPATPPDGVKTTTLPTPFFRNILILIHSTLYISIDTRNDRLRQPQGD